MAKNLFLTGTKRSGKSTFLKEALFPYRHLLGGYYIQRVSDPETSQISYRILDIASDPYYELNATEPLSSLSSNKGISFSDNIIATTSGNYKGIEMHPAVLETRGVQLLEAAQNKSLILMDELGRIEQHAPRFSETVFTILRGPIPVIGVLKKEHNFFLDQISLRHAHVILDLDDLTPESVQKQIKDFLLPITLHTD